MTALEGVRHDLPEPAYRQLAAILTQQIQAGRWRTGPLPSVKALQSQYGVGRDTVLHALQLRIFRVVPAQLRAARALPLRISWSLASNARPRAVDSPGTWEWELVPGPSFPPLGFHDHDIRPDQTSLDICPGHLWSAKFAW